MPYRNHPLPTRLYLGIADHFPARRSEWVLAVIMVTRSEQAGTPQLAALGLDQQASTLMPGGNMEGKESRFGIAASSLFAVVTTAASCGAVNAMHDSFTPLGGLIPLLQMQLGEVIFGGVGAGFYGMALFVLLTVFVCGLMSIG